MNHEPPELDPPEVRRILRERRRRERDDESGPMPLGLPSDYEPDSERRWRDALEDWR